MCVFHPFLHSTPHQNFAPENEWQQFIIFLTSLGELGSSSYAISWWMSWACSTRILDLPLHVIFHSGCLHNKEFSGRCSKRGKVTFTRPLRPRLWNLHNITSVMFCWSESLRLVQMQGGEERDLPLEGRCGIVPFHNGLHTGLGRICVHLNNLPLYSIIL